MFHIQLFPFYNVKIGFFNLKYSFSGSCPLEMLFTLLHVCKTETTHVNEAFS